MAQLITSDIWTLNGGEPDMEAFANGPVYGAIDSSRRDFTALVMLAERPAGFWNVWCQFWMLAEELAERSVRERVPYDLWAQQGRLTAVKRRDYGYLITRLAELSEQVDFRKLMYRGILFRGMPEAMQSRGVLNLAGALCSWSSKDMAGAVDALEALALHGRLRHGMHPVLTMCASTASMVMDPSGNRNLDKATSSGRIDGLVALAVAAKSAAAAAYGLWDYWPIIA